jgi:hypothetical protein
MDGLVGGRKKLSALAREDIELPPPPAEPAIAAE